MQRLHFRPAEARDMDALRRIVAAARVSLYRMGADQWQDLYPHSGLLRADLNAARLYVAADAHAVVGMMALSMDGEAAYDTLDGTWQTAPPYGTIHRLAVAEGCRRAGVAAFLLTHAARLCTDAGIGSLRVDTHRKNAPMRAFLEKQGFRYCGTVYYPGAGERLAFERDCGFTHTP